MDMQPGQSDASAQRCLLVPFGILLGTRPPGLPGVPLQLEVLLKLQVHFTFAAVRHAGNTGRFFNYSSKCVAMPLLQSPSGPWGQEVLRERYSEVCGQPGAEAGVRRLGAVLGGGEGTARGAAWPGRRNLQIPWGLISGGPLQPVMLRK